jgi:hypothetical protein
MLHGVEAGQTPQATTWSLAERCSWKETLTAIPVRGVLPRGALACSHRAPIVISRICPYSVSC